MAPRADRAWHGTPDILVGTGTGWPGRCPVCGRTAEYMALGTAQAPQETRAPSQVFNLQPVTCNLQL